MEAQALPVAKTQEINGLIIRCSVTAMLLTIQDLVKALQVKRSTLYAWAKQGKIPSLKINGVVRFVPQEIGQWLANSRLMPLPTPLVLSTGHKSDVIDVDALIERAKLEAYTPLHGETRPASPSGKEEDDGAR